MENGRDWDKRHQELVAIADVEGGLLGRRDRGGLGDVGGGGEEREE
jgi:hypothetical protein